MIFVIFVPNLFFESLHIHFWLSFGLDFSVDLYLLKLANLVVLAFLSEFVAASLSCRAFVYWCPILGSAKVACF